MNLPKLSDLFTMPPQPTDTGLIRTYHPTEGAGEPRPPLPFGSNGIKPNSFPTASFDADKPTSSGD